MGDQAINYITPPNYFTDCDGKLIVVNYQQVPSSDFRIFCFSTYVRLVSRELPPVLLDIHQTVILNTERQTAGLARVSGYVLQSANKIFYF